VTDDGDVTEFGAGHDWRETWVRARFPMVCIRCMTRSDSPAAADPCDRLTADDAKPASGRASDD
jgi:hypothetical protein